MNELIPILLLWCAFVAGLLVGVGALMVLQIDCKDCKREGPVRLLIGLILTIIACILSLL